MPNLIVIQGLPGSGKSTLATKLAADLGIPLMGKDTIKEFLFDATRVKSRDESMLLGIIAVRSLYVFAEEYLRSGKSVIIENAFMVDYAQTPIRKLLNDFTPNYIEIYCKTDDDQWRTRIAERAVSGARHYGHYDSEALLTIDLKKYAPLGLDPLSLTINTSKFGETEYQMFINKLKLRLV